MPCKSPSTAYWNKKMDEILNIAHMSPAKKILAYKIFLRPILLFDWVEGRPQEMKSLEIQALKRIFPGVNVRSLYSCYTDIDVAKYLKVEEIRWKRATGSGIRDIRKLLRGPSKTAADPAQYFTRAIDQSECSCECCTERTACTSANTNAPAETLTLRRSSRLANKIQRKREEP